MKREDLVEPVEKTYYKHGSLIEEYYMRGSSLIESVPFEHLEKQTQEVDLTRGLESKMVNQ